MVFTSLPIYLDPPGWNQVNNQLITPNTEPASHMLPPSIPNQPSQSANTGGKPGSMSERARLAKIPQPEQALKCPRCDSTNTKFCYFNNYSLSQPRHFCKTCRRYWTRGGALRSVPVGGGCRRNKRSSSKSKSTASASSSSAAVASSSSNCSNSTATSGSTMIPSNFSPHLQLPFLSSLHSLADHQYGSGLSFAGTVHEHVDNGDYQIQQYHQQLQQFPFLGNGIYPNFHGDGNGGELGFHLPIKAPSAGLITQMASVKMEDSHPTGLSLAREYLGMPRNDQYIGGGWASTGDLSGFNSSSGNIL